MPKANTKVTPNARPDALRLSVIVPVYNELHLLETSIGRVLALDAPIIESIELIAVDDCSTDGSGAILDRLAAEDSRIVVLRHDTNQGKGRAVVNGIRHARGDVTIIHDADLEYHPDDIPRILEPFLTEGADAVFGSRYVSGPYRRALMFKHSVMNRSLTWLSNIFTDLDLTDVETCYKAVRTPLLQSIPLRSPDFRIEVELAAKLAKRHARVFEVPIRYLPRSYAEGKKIRARDGALAVLAMFRYWLVDDIYQADEYGSQLVAELEKTRRYNDWVGAAIRPSVGDRVLELGAGVATLTSHLIPRMRYVVSDANPNYLYYLRSYALGKPYLTVREIDCSRGDDFAGLEEQFDTVVARNVLELVDDPTAALRHMHGALEPGGLAIVVVPHQPQLYGTLDEALHHRCRFDRETLRESAEAAGFAVERLTDFNRASVPTWFFNGRVTKRRALSRLQLKAFDSVIPALRRLDKYLPWQGQSLIGFLRKA